ncbi:MAG: invasion associated locus B family protein [Hyphomicrobiales bacterium]
MKFRNFQTAAALLSAAILTGGLAANVNGQTKTDAKPKVEREVHADWIVECITPQQQKRVCYMIQVHQVIETKKTIFQVLILKQRNAVGYSAVVLAPLGVLLPKGLVVSAKGANPLGVAFNNCGQRGCVARFNLSPELQGAFKSGASANFRMVNAGSGKPVAFTVSLSGFSAALKRVAELSPGS